MTFKYVAKIGSALSSLARLFLKPLKLRQSARNFKIRRTFTPIA